MEINLTYNLSEGELNILSSIEKDLRYNDSVVYKPFCSSYFDNLMTLKVIDITNLVGTELEISKGDNYQQVIDQYYTKTFFDKWKDTIDDMNKIAIFYADFGSSRISTYIKEYHKLYPNMDALEWIYLLMFIKRHNYNAYLRDNIEILLKNMTLNVEEIRPVQTNSEELFKLIQKYIDQILG